MGTILILLLVLSVPVFYIIGAIDFFKTIFGKKKTNGSFEIERTKVEKEIISEISEFVKEHPKANISELLQFLKSEQKHHPLEITFTATTKPDREEEPTPIDDTEVLIPSGEESMPTELSEIKPHKRQEPDLWQNWYAENSINLLLYVGAFFIVASASIFVGFQWESIGQEIKAILLTALTLAFLISGFFFYKNPKVKNAALTFSAIGSILMPLTGVGWYNFVLKQAGISFGLTWCITSIIAIGLYVWLGIYFKNKFYGYVTSLAIWSLSLSFVSLSNLDGKFYILASIISNFFILAFHLLTRTKDEAMKTIFAEPLEISTSILMPLTLTFGLLISLSDNMFLSMEVAISLFLASCYYYLFYSFTQKNWQLALSELLFPIFLVSLFGWQKAADYRLFFTLIILAFADIGISFFMIKNKLADPSWISTTIGTSIAILSFVSILLANYGAYYSLFASILLIIFGITTTVVQKKYEFLHISSVSLLILIYIFFHDIIGLHNKEYLLGIFYLIVGTTSFVGTWLIKDKQKSQLIPLLVLSILSLLLGFVFSVSNEYAILVVLLTYAMLFQAASYRFSITSLLYLSNLFLSISLYQIIWMYSIDQVYQPFLFATLALSLYSLSYVFTRDTNRSDRYKFSGLLLFITTPLIFGLQSVFTNTLLEKSALITAYLATAVFVFESTRTESEENENFQSYTYLVAILTALWQFKFVPTSDLYTIVLSITTALLIAIASFYRKKNPLLIFISNLFITITLFQIIQQYSIDAVFQPFIFITLAGGLYVLSFLFSRYQKHQESYKHSAFAVAIITPIFYGIQSTMLGSSVEKSALISAYIATVIFGFESAIRKNESFRYATSAIVLVTILWQIKILQFTELQMYAIPLGLYFLLLAYTRKIKEDKNGEEMLNAGGIAILLLTSMSQSFGPNSAVYALLHGIEGILFLLLGISTNNKLFRYAGIAAVVIAVLSQTYSYLFSLPRWLITGLAGIIFLTVAIFLLLKRNPEDHNKD